MKKIAITILVLLTSQPQAMDNGIEINLTISGKIFIGINHRIYFSDRSSVRYGLSMGFSGTPVGANLSFLKELSKDDAWSPYVGIGVDALYSVMRGRKVFIPYLKSIGGIAYKPASNLAHQSEFWLAFFPRAKRTVPIGISLSHFNAVLK
jgi:hypothetical protein